MNDQLLTIRDAAARLTIKPSSLRRWILQRKIEHVKISPRAVRIPLGAVERILDEGYCPAENGQ
jgi:excisionase family DNA binding protein